MNLTLPVIGGKVIKVWALPAPLSLTVGSPTLGQPNLVSVQPGSYSQGPGFGNFPVPNYNTMTVTVRAAGGGGALYEDVTRIDQGSNGGNSSFASATPLTAIGGLGHDNTTNPPPADQGGSGGTVTVGGGGAAGQGGELQGVPQYVVPNANYNGSAGGRVTKTWNRADVGAPVPGTIIGLTIGAGGAPGTNNAGLYAYKGGDGLGSINWS